MKSNHNEQKDWKRGINQGLGKCRRAINSDQGIGPRVWRLKTQHLNWIWKTRILTIGQWGGAPRESLSRRGTSKDQRCESKYSIWRVGSCLGWVDLSEPGGGQEWSRGCDRR